MKVSITDRKSHMGLSIGIKINGVEMCNDLRCTSRR